MLTKQTYLGVGITDATEEQVSEYIFHHIATSKKKVFIVTPNPELLVIAHKDAQYRHVLNAADISLPDGVGLFLATLLLGRPLKERIPGSDYVEDLCRRSRKKPVSMGFLGAGSGVAQRTAERLIRAYPWIKVRWIGQEWEGNRPIKKQKHVDIDGSNKYQFLSPYIPPHDPIDILFVAFGSPKQEKWIYEHLDELPVKVVIGVGGAFDFISGEVIRAPYLIRAMGFEWLFRLITQPWRIKRQLSLLTFIRLVFQEKFSFKSSHK